MEVYTSSLKLYNKYSDLDDLDDKFLIEIIVEGCDKLYIIPDRAEIDSTIEKFNTFTGSESINGDDVYKQYELALLHIVNTKKFIYISDDMILNTAYIKKINFKRPDNNSQK